LKISLCRIDTYYTIIVHDGCSSCLLKDVLHLKGYLSLPEIIGTTRVENIKRQINYWDKNAVVAFRDAKPLCALNAYQQNNQLKFCCDQNDTIQQLVQHYLQITDHNKLVIAHSWKICNLINQHIQSVLAVSTFQNNQYKLLQCTVSDKYYEYKFYTGEKIRFTTNFNFKKIRNGDTAIIISFFYDNDGNETIKVKMDDGTTRNLSKVFFQMKRVIGILFWHTVLRFLVPRG